MTVRIMVQINILILERYHCMNRINGLRKKGEPVSDIFLSQGHGDAYDMVEGNGGDPR